MRKPNPRRSGDSRRTGPRRREHRGPVRLPSRSSTDVHPPPDFRRPAIAGPLYFVSTALFSSALPHARTAPQTPLASKRAACQWTPLDKLEERRGSNGRRPKTSQHLRAISLSHAGERCNVDSQVNPVVCDSRTPGFYGARYRCSITPPPRRNNSPSNFPGSPGDIDRAPALALPASTVRPRHTGTSHDDPHRSVNAAAFPVGPWRKSPSGRNPRRAYHEPEA